MLSRSHQDPDAILMQHSSKPPAALSRLNSLKATVRDTAAHMTRKRTAKSNASKKSVKSHSRLRLPRKLKGVPKPLPDSSQTSDKSYDDQPDSNTARTCHTDAVVVSSSECNTITMPVDLVHDLLQILTFSQSLPQIQKAHEACKDKLSDLENELGDVCWSMRLVINSLCGSVTLRGQSKEEAETWRAEQLNKHQHRLQVTERAKDSASMQTIDLTDVYREVISHHEALINDVLHRVRTQTGLSTEFDPSSTLQALQVKPPIERAELERYKLDVRAFREIDQASEDSGEVERRPDRDFDGYPLTLQEDWTVCLSELDTCRKAHRAEYDTFNEMRDAMPDAMPLHDMLGANPELKEQVTVTIEKYDVLQQAIEDARMAGLICASTGSVFCEDDGIIDELTYDRERPRRWVGDDEEEMSYHRRQEYLARNRENTERWLESAVLDRDPDTISPRTPRTPGSAAFGVRADEIEVDDSVSVHDANDDSDDSDDSYPIRRVKRAE